MKKVVLALAALLVAAVIASGATASGGPLFQEEGILCGVIDRDGSGVLTEDSLLVWYSSGKVSLRCLADGTPGSNIVTFSGFYCGLGPFGSTTDSTNRVGRNGHIQLSCTGWADPEDTIDSASSGAVGAG
jgi:hypothetical protein